jgi:hypothetical protein
MLWKERNRWIFEDMQSSHIQVAMLTQEEIKLQLSVFDWVGLLD